MRAPVLGSGLLLFCFCPFVIGVLPSPISESFCATSEPHRISVPNSAASYHNDETGLSQMLRHMLLAAKYDNRDELHSQIVALRIPDYRIWFRNVFGRERGNVWADAYGRSLDKTESEFEHYLIALAREDGDFSVVPLHRQHSVDQYFVRWKESSEKVTSIGYFYFVDNGFRFDSSIPLFRIHEDTTAFIRLRPVFLVSPEYPTRAKRDHVQGTVKLNVAICKDGSVTVQDVAEGDPIFRSAAIKAAAYGDTSRISLTANPLKCTPKSM